MTSHTLPDDPNYCFCPAYDAEDICDRLNRRLGLDRDAWTELAAGSMRAEDSDPDTGSRH